MEKQEPPKVKIDGDSFHRGKKFARDRAIYIINLKIERMEVSMRHLKNGYAIKAMEGNMEFIKKFRDKYISLLKKEIKD